MRRWQCFAAQGCRDSHGRYDDRFMRDIGERNVPGFKPANICDAIGARAVQ
jgi:hypothetical protein